MRRIFFILRLTVLCLIVSSAASCATPLGNAPRTPVADSQLEIPTQAALLATPRAITPPRPARVNGFKTIALAELPLQARATLQLIERGGPFPYRQDGQIFQNREGLLPKKDRGYYHEYTVKTPSEEDRGARRIVTGAQGELYYTDDHYGSFKVIVTDE